jgi:hypothetical protein
MSTRTLAARAGAEMLGSLMTYCLAVGSLSNALLPRTKGEGAPQLSPRRLLLQHFVAAAGPRLGLNLFLTMFAGEPAYVGFLSLY